MAEIEQILGRGAPEQEDKLVASFCVSRPQALSQLVVTKRKKPGMVAASWWPDKFPADFFPDKISSGIRQKTG